MSQAANLSTIVTILPIKSTHQITAANSAGPNILINNQKIDKTKTAAETKKKIMLAMEIASEYLNKRGNLLLRKLWQPASLSNTKKRTRNILGMDIITANRKYSADSFHAPIIRATEPISNIAGQARDHITDAISYLHHQYSKKGALC